MTVVNSPRRRPTTASLSPVPENEEGPDSSRSRSPISLPTEYNQSFRPRNLPRPRNPVSGWQTRNISSILPLAPGPPPERARPLRRRPENLPWLTRQESQVFPETRTEDELNNNPDLGLPRRRPQWPWQARAQTSHIFYSDAITSPSLARPTPQRASRSQSGSNCYPWQERAKKSVIFDVLTSKEIAKVPKVRKYDWDQRQSNSISACVQQKKDERTQTQTEAQASSSSSSSSISSNSKKWPWQERAMQSVIFTSPDKKLGNREMKYVWDQRKTRFSVKLDPEAKFSQGSHYSDNYVHWQKITGDRTKPAGRPCYKEEDVDLDSQKKVCFGKRRVQGRAAERKRSSSVIIAHPTFSQEEKMKIPAGSKSTSSGSVKIKTNAKTTRGSTCMELVPVDFDFKDGTHGGKGSKTSPKKVQEEKKAEEKVGSPKKDVNGNIEI